MRGREAASHGGIVTEGCSKAGLTKPALFSLRVLVWAKNEA
jgi:hypothetical protein